MSGIAQVIAQAREPGDFVERREFTVERQAAVRKMRQFALEEPHHYVLELVRAAVANDARIIDLRIDANEAMVTWVGKGFDRVEVERLFDYLFASSDELDVADLRHLALAVNALFTAKPKRIVWTTGRGTIVSTTRLELDPRTGAVTVGTPSTALNGTLLVAEGMDRRSLGSVADGEELTLHKRCYLSPVPIVFNAAPITEAWSAQRSPGLAWADRRLELDEGDLHGTVGWGEGHKRPFSVVHFGVIAGTSYGPRGQRIADGGILHFDRLNLSADQSRVVHDAVWDELWQRVALYALDTAKITNLNGEVLYPPALRERAARAKTVIAIAAAPTTDAQRDRLARLRARVSDEVWVVDPALGRAPWIAALGEIVWSDLDDAAAVEFLLQPAAQPPAKPWLTAPVVLPKIHIRELQSETHLPLPEDPTRGNGPFPEAVFEPVVYTPADTAAGAAHFELWVHGRLAWEGSVGLAVGPHVIVHAEGVTASQLVARPGSSEEWLYGADVRWSQEVGRVLAIAIAKRLDDQILAVRQRAVRATTRAADPVQNAMVRETALAMVRGKIYLALGSGQPALRVWGDHRGVLRVVPICQSVTGAAVSVATLEGMLQAHGGLLDVAQDYVRPKGNAPATVIVHSHEGELGLREDVGMAPVVEGGHLDGTPEQKIAGYTRYLEAGKPREREFAWRWLVQAALSTDETLYARLRDVPLIMKTNGEWTTAREVRLRVDASGPVPMQDGWVFKVPASRPASRAMAEDDVLAPHPVVWACLHARGWVRPWFATAHTDNPWLIQRSIAAGAVEGWVSVPSESTAPRGVWVVTPTKTRRLRVAASSILTGVTFSTAADAQRSAAVIEEKCAGVVDDLLGEVLRLRQGARHDQLLGVALSLLAEDMVLQRDAVGTVSIALDDPKLRPLTTALLFRLHGDMPVSLRELVVYLTQAVRDGAEVAWAEVLSAATAPQIRQWCERALANDRVVEAPVTAPAALPAQWSDPKLAGWLRRMLADFGGLAIGSVFVMVARHVRGGRLDGSQLVRHAAGLMEAKPPVGTKEERGQWRFGSSDTWSSAANALVFDAGGLVASAEVSLGLFVALDGDHPLAQAVLAEAPDLERALLLFAAVQGALNAQHIAITDHDEVEAHASGAVAGEARSGGRGGARVSVGREPTCVCVRCTGSSGRRAARRSPARAYSTAMAPILQERP